MTDNTIRIRKDYSMAELIFGNLAIILWIVLGSLSCALLVPLTAFLFFGATAFLVFYELGKHGCVSCFYCKTCTIGMGKLPGLFFRAEGLVNVNRRALKLFPLVYLLLSVLPIAVVAFSFLQGVTVYKATLLVSVLAFSVYTGIIRGKALLS